jgi:metal-responsive CopG/Arc/MetJ family transcriptional regulator
MEKQNITLALPKDVLKRVKVMAAERGTSISAIMEHLLQDHLARHEGYEKAHQRQSAMLIEGFDLGTNGQRTWRREELHVR